MSVMSVFFISVVCMAVILQVLKLSKLRNGGQLESNNNYNDFPPTLFLIRFNWLTNPKNEEHIDRKGLI